MSDFQSGLLFGFLMGAVFGINAIGLFLNKLKSNGNNVFSNKKKFWSFK